MRELFKKDKPYAVKKCVALAVIFLGMIFVLANRDVYYSDHTERVKITTESFQNPVIIEFEGNKVFEQQFQGWNGELTAISLRFKNQGNQAATGTATLNVLDEDGQVLMTSVKAVSNLRTTKKSHFRFDSPLVLSENRQYVLQMIIEDAQNSQGFGVFTYPEKGALFGDMQVDGQSDANRLAAIFNYHYYNMGAVVHMYMFFAFALIFVLFPFYRVDAFVEKKWNRKLDCNRLVSRIFFLATPVLCFMLTDRFNGYTIKGMIYRIFTWKGVFNIFIYAVVWIVVYFIVNRTQYTSMIVLTLVFVAGIANYYVWIFRGCPILATDLQSAKTALNVAQNFSYTLDLTGVWGCVYLVSFLSMLLSLKGYKSLNPKKRAVVFILAIAAVGGFNVIFFRTDVVKNRGITAEVWHPQQRYAKNGTALSFVLSWSYTKVEKPSGYSKKRVDEIVEGYESDEAAEPSAMTPNIIAIMNESLADLSYNGNIEFSEDYLPFLHSMEENTVKGKLYVSIEGANTANSEFEFLTGNSMMFLPFRCIPYNLYVSDGTPSMAQNMNAQGYQGINAYHPYLRSGWNRENVYACMGFHNFFSQEYYYENGNDALIRNYISDEADFDQIIDDFNAAKTRSDEPFYLFNVTMQNHGGYDGKRGVVDTDITIESDELVYDEAEQYINLAKKSDEAFEKLVRYFEQVDEPTMIVMFGDHQPPITNAFYSAQFKKNVDNLPKQKQAAWYSTPYVIWTNYDIEEAVVDMSANYLSSYVMQLAGLKLTGYNKYLLELQKTLPVISAVCYMDAEGNVYANDEKSEYSDLLEEYQMVQYNQLFDLENRKDDFFFLK